MADPDKAIADEVRAKIADLNSVLSKAANAGIEVDIEQIDATTMGCPARELKLLARCRQVTEI